MTGLEFDSSATAQKLSLIVLLRSAGVFAILLSLFAFYYGTLPKNGYVYLRHAASLGVTVRF